MTTIDAGAGGRATGAGWTTPHDGAVSPQTEAAARRIAARRAGGAYCDAPCVSETAWRSEIHAAEAALFGAPAPPKPGGADGLAALSRQIEEATTKSEERFLRDQFGGLALDLYRSNRLVTPQAAAPVGEAGSGGHTEASGFAASLRQMALWYEAGFAEDIDPDDLRGAADLIERLAAAPTPPAADREAITTINAREGSQVPAIRPRTSSTSETESDAIASGSQIEKGAGQQLFSTDTAADREAVARADLHPLPWTGKEEDVPIGDTGDSDVPFVIRDADGAIVEHLWERYALGHQAIHCILGERIVAGVNALATDPAPASEAPRTEGLTQAAWDASGDGWQPIETAPKDGTLIQGYMPWGVRTIWKIEAGWVWYESPSDAAWCVPTHWRPLPAPPSDRAPASGATERRS